MEKSVKSSIEIRPESSGDLIAYNIKGIVTVDDIKEAHDNLLELLDRHKKLKMLINIEDMKGVEPKAVIQDLKFTLHYLNDFSGVAIVGNKKWHELLVEFSDVLLEFKMKYYEANNIEKAHQWLNNL